MVKKSWQFARRREEHRNSFEDRSNSHTKKRRRFLTEEDRTVVSQSMYHSIGEEEWSDIHQRLTEVCNKIGFMKACFKDC